MAARIPLVITTSRDQNTFQTQLSKTLTPILQCPIIFGGLIQAISLDSQGSRVTSNFINLASGANVIQHQLGRTPQGYFIVRQKAAAEIYDTWDAQDPKSQPLQTIVTFNSSAAVTVSIWLY